MNTGDRDRIRTYDRLLRRQTYYCFNYLYINYLRVNFQVWVVKKTKILSPQYRTQLEHGQVHGH